MMCNKEIKKSCTKECKKCDYWDKNLEKLMSERSEIDVGKCGK